MDWFNYYGLIFTVIIMIPNIIFAVKNKDRSFFAYKNKAAETFEQIGRYACIVFMIFNVPYTWFGYFFRFAEYAYIAVNGVLAFAYCLAWILLWKKSGVARAVILSVLPSLIFLFSGAMITSVPLIAFGAVFAVTHILISVKSAILSDASVKE